MARKARADASLELSLLHQDPQAAAAIYRDLHRRLTQYFEWKGCPAATDLADKTIDTGLRRLGEGVAVTVTLHSYFMGIARWVEREDYARRRRHVSMEETNALAVDTSSATELRLQLDRVLSTLSAEERQLLTEYFLHDRTALAASLDTTIGALRVRIHRIVSRLREHWRGELP